MEGRTGGPCILRGEENVCKEVEKIEPVHMAVPTMIDFEAAVSRIQELEESVSQLHRLMQEQGNTLARLPHTLGEASTHIGTSLQGSFPGTSDTAREGKLARLGSFQKGANVQEREHEDMAMILEDFAMNNRANRDRAVQNMATAGTANTSDDEANNLDPAINRKRGIGETGIASIPVGSPPRLPGFAHLLPPLPTPDGHFADVEGSHALDPSHPLSGLTSNGTDHISRFLAQGPDPSRAWQLVQFYITHLEWYSRVLHAPTFLEECKTFLALPPQTASRARHAFLATYFVVLCIALQYIGEQEKADLGYTTEQAQNMCLSMFSAAQAMLNLSDYLAVHSLENLQVIVFVPT